MVVGGFGDPPVPQGKKPCLRGAMFVTVHTILCVVNTLPPQMHFFYIHVQPAGQIWPANVN